MAAHSSHALGPTDLQVNSLQEATYHRIAERLETLQQLTAALASARTMQELGEFVIDKVRPALRAEVGVIAVLTGSGKALRNVGFKGVSAETLDAWREYPLESPVPMAEAALTRKQIIVRTTEERNQRYPVLADVHGIEQGGAVICFPLMARGELVGALGFCFDCNRDFDADEVRFFQALADQCALAVERAAWYERAQREIEARRQAEERLTRVLASIDDHLVAYDRQWRYVFVNDQATKVLGKTREELLGRSIWDIFPDAIGNQYYRELHQALEEQRIIRSEHYYTPFDTWFENRIYPSADGVTVFSANVSWRKKAEQALLEADRRKDEFLATLAHELRNPLAPIVQATHVMKSPNATARQKEWGLSVIDRQARHMARLLDDLLDVSRITRGCFELRRENTELARVIEVAVETAKPAIEARNHKLTVQVPDKPVALNADAVRLAQVVANLLTNAAKYTEQGGDIRLYATTDAREAVIEVKDNGIGLEPGSIPLIFQMFCQVGTPGRMQDGLGIGLALAKSLIEMHGGVVEARSEGPGRGSEFIVRLPRGQ